MFKPFFFVLKLTFFTAFILIFSHIVEWNGKTVSDQVRSQMSSAQRTTDWIGDMKDKALKWMGGIGSDSALEDKKPRSKPVQKSSFSRSNEFTPTERQKLRALIQELNQNAAN